MTLSGLISISLFFWDERRTEAYVRLTAGGISRQLCSQLETFALHLKNRGESEPLEKAAQLLGRGLEPRFFRLNLVDLGKFGSIRDSFEYDRTTGWLTYIKMVAPEIELGVEIKLLVGNIGFLGSRSQLTSDLMIILVFLATNFLIFSLGMWFLGGVQLRGLKYCILEWIGQAREVVQGIAYHVKTLTLESSKLVEKLQMVQSEFFSLREKIHLGIEKAHQGRLSYQDYSKQFDNKISKLGEVLQEIKSELKIQTSHAKHEKWDVFVDQMELGVSTLKTHLEYCARIVSDCEKEFEPAVVEADFLFHQMQDYQEVSKSVICSVRGTKDELLKHTKLLHFLRTKGS